jgi:3D-(3,5/4)-trihydroxycyclohexane-1,2-dione acylhydrolase (decyclizing)
VEVDFAANAASMGCATWAVRTPEEFAHALEQARASDGPALICAEVEPTRYLSPNGTFWDVGVPLASGSEDTRKRVELHEEARKRQRFLGATTAPDETA